MIPLLYQLSYTAPGKFRGLRYCIAALLSRKSIGIKFPTTNDKSQIINIEAQD
jgi:hypothetical protein